MKSVIVVFLALAASACAGPEQKRASEREAKQWAKDLGIQYTGVSCNDYDSDGDGYVSCTIAVQGGDTKQIECRGAYSMGHGCRDPKLTIRQTK